MGLLAFRRACEISVMEVGLGGRLDATNVIQPDLCIVTPVAFDHEAFLGNTLTAIAAEKAGILKPNIPLVLARQVPEAESVILDRARELNCPVIRTLDAHVAVTAISRFASQFEHAGVLYDCPLAGAHQVENAIAAILAARALGIDSLAMQRGIQNVRWPGRLEYVARNPDFILDGAHNPAGARALATYIRDLFGDQSIWIVYGAMRDKAIDEVAAQLFPLADRLIVTAPDFPRALRPEAILELYPHPNAVATRNLPDAIALARGAPPETAVFFTGSLYLVGEARRLLVT
jgi:dihydrofolate synthase/folylpolyglutamate synthase